MQTPSVPAALTLGLFLAVGLAALGHLLAEGLLSFKAQDRTVTVKGLAEREVPADVAIWPIKFSEPDNDLEALYATLQRKNALVREYLEAAGFDSGEISTSAPAIVDRKAQGYSGPGQIEYRYTGTSTLTVYSHKVDRVREAMQSLAELGKRGVAIAGEASAR